MDIFHYHPTTGKYLGKSIAQTDPLGGKPILPAHATSVTPPSPKAGHANVYKGGTWSQVVDQRGTKYWLPDGSAHEITMIGETLPAGATTTPPEPLLKDVKTKAKAVLKAEHAAFLDQLSDYPSAPERASWPAKSEAAYAYIEGTARPDQKKMIESEAEGKETDPNELCLAIIDLSVRYGMFVGTARAFLSKSLDRVEAIATAEAWDRLKDDLMAEATALAETTVTAAEAAAVEEITRIREEFNIPEKEA